MSNRATQITDVELQERQERRAQLLMQREHAALQRRRRGFTVRRPSSQPLVVSARRRGA